MTENAPIRNTELQYSFVKAALDEKKRRKSIITMVESSPIRKTIRESRRKSMATMDDASPIRNTELQYSFVKAALDEKKRRSSLVGSIFKRRVSDMSTSEDLNALYQNLRQTGDAFDDIGDQAAESSLSSSSDDDSGPWGMNNGQNRVLPSFMTGNAEEEDFDLNDLVSEIQFAMKQGIDPQTPAETDAVYEQAKKLAMKRQSIEKQQQQQQIPSSPAANLDQRLNDDHFNRKFGFQDLMDQFKRSDEYEHIVPSSRQCLEEDMHVPGTADLHHIMISGEMWDSQFFAEAKEPDEGDLLNLI